jgi:hypothetical protein
LSPLSEARTLLADLFSILLGGGMMVTVKLFGMTKSLAGNQSSLALASANGRRVKDLVELLNAGYPMIGELIHKKKFWCR